MESNKDNQLEINQPQTKKQIFIKINLFALLITVAMLLISAIFLGTFAYSKFNNFSQIADVSKSDFYQTLTTGWQQTPTESQGYKNFLVLGVDTLETRGSSTPLTDSIMLASINLQTGAVVTLPLPRDLWSEAYQTKINALYTYGLERYPESPQKFSKEVISELTDIDIHHTLVVSMEAVAEVIDLVGGVEIDVKQEFIDEEFPRTDVDVTIETNRDNLYETIEFKTGLQTMDGQTALKYMRSRHGNNDQNTDGARSNRQQDVIQALVKKTIDKETLLNTDLTGQLYRYYLNNFADDLSPTELIATGKEIFKNKDNIRLENTNLGVYPDDPTGTIEHPAQYLYDGQWIYSIRSESEFKKDIQNKLTK
jgi:LCP family protein required for cell wall assembly